MPNVTLDLADPIAVLLATAEALRRASIKVAAYGGLALAAYGAPRETKDADLTVVGTTGADAAKALAAAGIESLVAFDRVRFGGNRLTRLTLLPNEGAAALNTADLVEPLSPRYARAVLDRAYETVLRGKSIRIATPEDFILLKILSTRDRDVEDAATIMSSLGSRLDSRMIDLEAAALAAEIPDHDVSGRLQRARAAAGTIS
jgi:hypothetical protein